VDRTPGQLLKEARRRHGVSQARLAARAGTTQSAISRIESEKVSPTFETLHELLYLLGEDLQLSTAARDTGVDRSQVRERFRLSPTERVEYGRAFADMVIENSPAWRRRRTAA
jgi:transcriptional regulator with XRE-family HTH domain